MRSSILSFVVLVLATVQGWAAPVNVSQAQMVAQNFANANGNFNASPGRSIMKLAYAEKSGALKEQPVFYVFNSSDSYVIVAGDDRAEQILGFGDGQFDINDIPCGMRYLLGVYKKEIEFLQVNPMLKVAKISQGTPSLNASSVSKLLSTTWGQGSPYYNQCPTYSSYGHCATGCVATALSQIMYYWKYPTSAPAMSAYTTTWLKIAVPSLPAKTFNWTTLGSSNDAKAWLMRYAGQAVSMDYAPAKLGGSGATDSQARSAMVNKFKYSSSASLKTRTSSITNTQWNTWIKTELNAGRPVYYGADDDNGQGGHAFVIDGYNTAGKYHINWGWDGAHNDYFALDAFNTDGLMFNSNQAMIINLRPSTVVSAPSSITLSSKTVGKTYTYSFTVKGTYLTGGLTLKLTGATGVFSISRTSITKTEATNGATVTVTYKPTAAGTQNATITISGGGLTANKTISLKGTSVVRKITPSVTTLAFGSIKRYSSIKKTFKVSGTNLTGSLTLKVTGPSSGMFILNKTTITASQAAAGAEVSVTYTPASIGFHRATITISGGDAESKTIILSGKGISNGGITPLINSLEDVVDISRNDPDLDILGTKTGSGNGGVIMAPSNPSTDVNDLTMNSRIYAEGQNIIIESPVDQSAIISDISGRAKTVSLQAGRNEIPVNASGIYIVRIGEKTTKLML